ncbi:MAG TPA: NAD-dependent epimerase/dehydratase family protein [Usitatibacter sp.]|jgi:nucleoside-diphosphate-sugar epimerase|nr:NAD-dependent epimerase/dehydratase family protein [Usitatibacter sp.]
MIIGSGLIARAFSPHAPTLNDTCIYAAGVSNSGCTDPSEFARDEDRLRAAIASMPAPTRLVYFSTCSVGDPSMAQSGYVLHKRRLESLVEQRPPYLVVRLPQVAGRTPNPHTLLNYLYARITRSEKFDLWKHACRNIIDVDDAAAIILYLIRHEQAVDEIINVANPRSSSMTEIVQAIEAATHHRAVYRLLDRGAAYEIDTSRITKAITTLQLPFGDAYLSRTVAKYYYPHVQLQP